MTFPVEALPGIRAAFRSVQGTERAPVVMFLVEALLAIGAAFHLVQQAAHHSCPVAKYLVGVLPVIGAACRSVQATGQAQVRG